MWSWADTQPRISYQDTINSDHNQPNAGACFNDEQIWAVYVWCPHLIKKDLNIVTFFVICSPTEH